jgi:CBS domain containing-hemolysin-like protein
LALLLIALGLAVLLSAFLSAAELAVFSLAEGRVRALAEQETRGAAALAQLRARPERVLVLLRLGDAFADVSAGALAAYIAYLQWDYLGLALAIAGATLLVLYFGELMPIGLAVNHGLRLALLISPVLLLLTRILGLPLAVLGALANVRPNRRDAAATVVTETEIRQLTALGHTEGGIEAHERELIERAFRLDQTKTWEVMTPRVDIFAWKDTLLLKDLAPELGTVRYSRVPVYGTSIDDITGVLYVRDAYQALISGQRDVPLRTLAREPLIVPGSVALTRLLRDFQTRRIHMAIVLDEYGGTDGLVTLEDVIEELVGEIDDETDLPEDAITRVSRTEIVATGDVDLREINHFFNTALPQLEHRSLNGYLLEELGHVPEAGETLERDGVRIEVMEATDTQVLRARLRRTAAAAESAQRSLASGADDGDLEAGFSRRSLAPEDVDELAAEDRSEERR